LLMLLFFGCQFDFTMLLCILCVGLYRIFRRHLLLRIWIVMFESNGFRAIPMVSITLPMMRSFGRIKMESRAHHNEHWRFRRANKWSMIARRNTKLWH
jgi:hypothetical protein